MGVPKFFRWMSERYPKMNQRTTCFVDPTTYNTYFPTDDPNYFPPPPLDSPDALSTCGLNPEIDRLYIDMNGVLHGCSHNNSNDEGEAVEHLTSSEIFRNVCYYLDRIVRDIAQPKQLVYMAIDGVAPRAKMNQQRARRYRSGNSELERSIYDEIQQTLKAKQEAAAEKSRIVENKSGTDGMLRWSGKFEADSNHAFDDSFHDDDDDVYQEDDMVADPVVDGFQSNTITPGTEFFGECVAHLEHWVQYKLTTDPKWQHLEIIFSGSNVPGEGEHKIMDFMRHQRSLPDYDPNLRHCIVGQDGDLILLGLATHEPNLVLLRERFLFETDRRKAWEKLGVEAYLHNVHFEWLHMSVLRDYLMFELETAPAVPNSPWDRERTIDDFVFMTFLVGNDFLPGLPALDIADGAFELLFYTYIHQRRNWYITDSENPYLTHKGNIVSGRRLQSFLGAIGRHETAYYDNKRSRNDLVKIREADERAGRETHVPTDEIINAKEQADRANYRAMLQSTIKIRPHDGDVNGHHHDHDDHYQQNDRFEPVVSEDASVFQTIEETEEESKAVETGFLMQMGRLLQQSLAPNKSVEDNPFLDSAVDHFDDQDLKGRYYYDKFGFSPLDADKHLALRKSYLEGLVWNLKYYYEGCVSWEWYYPYHYGPMMSDLVNIDSLLKEISFHDPGKPLRPFEQLMGCLPPSSASLLPKPYQWLLTDKDSPIADFYPTAFTVDMNGKQWPWEAVVLLPFIDSKRLISAARAHVKENMLSEEERRRNREGTPKAYKHNTKEQKLLPKVTEENSFQIFGEFTSKAKCEELRDTKWQVQKKQEKTVTFEPELLEGAETPKPGFPSLTAAPIRSLWRKRSSVNTFGRRSRYRTANLTLDFDLPPFPPLQLLFARLNGSRVYINYPYLTEAFVTAVSDPIMSIRGKNGESIKQWSSDESDEFKSRLQKLIDKLETGEGFTGTGGWIVPKTKCDIIVSVRPLKNIITMKDGTIAKVYAKFELDVPLIAALWGPRRPDPRLVDLPSALEQDPYFISSKPIELTPRGLLPRRGTSKTTTTVLASSRAFCSLAHTHSFKNQLLHRAVSSLNRLPTSLARSTHTAVPQSGTYQTIPKLAARRNPRIRILAFGVAAAATVLTGKGVGAELIPSQRLFSQQSTLVARVPRGGTADPNMMPFDEQSPPPLEFAHGTTTLCFKFQGGIIAAVDSRSTMGNFVGSKTVQKVIPINSHMLGTMAGGAADCSYWIRKIQAEASVHHLNEGRRMSVARASRILSNMVLRNQGLSMGTMILGFDDGADGVDERSSIFYVDHNGVRIKGDMFAVGSGSTFALGILDSEHRFDLTEEEAIALGIRAIRHATFRDAASGGYIGVYLITKSGWKKVFAEDLARSQA